MRVGAVTFLPANRRPLFFLRMHKMRCHAKIWLYNFDLVSVEAWMRILTVVPWGNILFLLNAVRRCIWAWITLKRVAYDIL